MCCSSSRRWRRVRRVQRRQHPQQHLSVGVRRQAVLGQQLLLLCAATGQRTRKSDLGLGLTVQETQSLDSLAERRRDTQRTWPDVGGASVMASAPRRQNTLLTCHTHAAPPNAQRRTAYKSSAMWAAHPSVALPAPARGVLQQVRTELFLHPSGSVLCSSVARARLGKWVVFEGVHCSLRCACRATQTFERCLSLCVLLALRCSPPLGPAFPARRVPPRWTRAAEVRSRLSNPVQWELLPFLPRPAAITPRRPRLRSWHETRAPMHVRSVNGMMTSS